MCSSLQSCCCISLEVGTQIISIINLLVPLVETGYCLYEAFSLPLEDVKTTSVYVVLAVLGIFELFCASVFMHGTFKKQPSFMVPWLVLAGLKALVLLVLFAVWVTVLALGGYQHYSQILFIVIFIVYAVTLLYFALVANSRRREIQNDHYAAYAPRRVSRSNSTLARSVYVPITKPLDQP